MSDSPAHNFVKKSADKTTTAKSDTSSASPVRKTVPIYENTLEKLKKQYLIYKVLDTNPMSFTQWLSGKLNSMVDKDAWLSKKYHNLQLVHADTDQMIIVDGRERGMAYSVFYKKNELWCTNCSPNEQECIHAKYAMQLPEIVLLQK